MEVLEERVEAYCERVIQGVEMCCICRSAPGRGEAASQHVTLCRILIVCDVMCPYQSMVLLRYLKQADDMMMLSSHAQHHTDPLREQSYSHSPLRTAWLAAWSLW